MTERDRLAEIEQRVAKALPGPWFWNSYDQIGAEVPVGHPWDVDPQGGVNGNGNKWAIVAWVAQAPEHAGMGDELHSEQARDNAEFIENSRADVEWLCQEVRRLQAVLHLSVEAMREESDD